MAEERIIFFDTGPIITLIMSRLEWILPELKKKFGGKFYITPAVKKELITRPMDIKRFEFEALQAMKLLRDGVLEVYENIPLKDISRLNNLANNSFKVDDKPMDVVQSGELESVACALKTNAAAIVMDERTLRLFIEDNVAMKSLLEHRFNKPITVDKEKIDQFSGEFSEITIVRSIELISVAYSMGLLDSYVPSMKNGRQILLDAVLWTAKYNGSAITEPEIKEIEKFLLKK